MAEISGPIAAVESSVIDISSTNSPRAKASSMDPKNVDCCEERSKSLRARYIYAIIFFIINLTAWFIRDYGHSVFPPTYCEMVEAEVLPIACINGGTLLHPSRFYSHLWIFLLLQLISVIEFIRWWNKYWSPDEQGNQSEPVDEKCNVQKPDNGKFDWTTILGFLIAIGAIVMATFSTGIDSKSFQFNKNNVKLEDDIRYNYGFFHMIFSLGAMYFAMLFISWNLKDSATEWSIDVGWASAGVKIINEWVAATIY
ncbi:hypothetical protein Goshw_006121, partial [Gossypium schwendimanii]|nr:hypothetical protein [Gossypium schwendimanii]